MKGNVKPLVTLQKHFGTDCTVILSFVMDHSILGLTVTAI